MSCTNNKLNRLKSAVEPNKYAFFEFYRTPIKINNDKEIVWSPSSVDIKVTSVKYFDPSDDSFIGELTGSDLEEFSKVYAKDMQSDFLEASTERTIMLQDNKYVTVSVDDDGEKETTTYNRL